MKATDRRRSAALLALLLFAASACSAVVEAPKSDDAQDDHDDGTWSERCDRVCTRIDELGCESRSSCLAWCEEDFLTERYGDCLGVAQPLYECIAETTSCQATDCADLAAEVDSCEAGPEPDCSTWTDGDVLRCACQWPTAAPREVRCSLGPGETHATCDCLLDGALVDSCDDEHAGLACAGTPENEYGCCVGAFE